MITDAKTQVASFLKIRFRRAMQTALLRHELERLVQVSPNKALDVVALARREAISQGQEGLSLQPQKRR